MIQMASSTPRPAVNGDRKHQLGEALRRRILTMKIAPGAVVDEVDLAEEFGMSRPPVREIIRQMAGEGYIELEANRPARATSMGYLALRDFYLVAPMIYVGTTKLAADAADQDDVARLRRIQADFRSAIECNDVNARIFANNEFHLEIGRIARNAYLLPSLRRLLIDHARIGRTFYRNDITTPEMLRVTADQHDQIIDAIEGHDPEQAGNLVQEHLDLSRRNMAAYAVPEGLDGPLGS